MAGYELGHGHYMLSAERHTPGTAHYDLEAFTLGYDMSGIPKKISRTLPPPTPLWFWAVW